MAKANEEKGINACISCAIIHFCGSHGIIHKLIDFKGVHELKVRQIDHNFIFGWCFIPIMAISSDNYVPINRRESDAEK